MSTKRILAALWMVRRGDPDRYQAGVNFGIAIGMASMLPYEQHVRLSDLALNAARYARFDEKKRQEVA
ncbi:hypothetical protein D9M68_138750 [compost metagenome]